MPDITYADMPFDYNQGFLRAMSLSSSLAMQRSQHSVTAAAVDLAAAAAGALAAPAAAAPVGTADGSGEYSVGADGGLAGALAGGAAAGPGSPRPGSSGGGSAAAAEDWQMVAGDEAEDGAAQGQGGGRAR